MHISSKIVVLAGLIFSWQFAWTLPARAIDVQRVETASGITSFLVEDYTLPIISIAFSFKGGSSQDPAGKEGAVALLTALLDEGAGHLDSSEFRAALEEYGIEMGFSDSTRRISGRVRTLVSEKDKAFELLALALNEPRFDASAVERVRNGFQRSLKRAQADPVSVGRNRLRELLFGNHPFGRAPNGTLETVSELERDDLKMLHQNLFSRDGLAIGVVGAINAADLVTALNRVFGDLPETAQQTTIPKTEPELGVHDALTMSVPNATISLVYQGLRRNDPDFFAAHLMNHILGGGSFSSRLYAEIREKRGLVYSVSSSLVSRPEAPFLIAGTQTRAENKDKVLQLMKAEIQKVAEGGITPAELETAKQYTIGSYAINNLDTSAKIARVLVTMQTQGLGADYIANRVKLINSVTLEDVHRIAKKLLSVEPTVVTVAPPAG